MPKKQLEITEAVEPAEIAADLIVQYHPHLEDAKFLYIFTNQKRKRCDRVRLGSAQRLGPLARFLASGRESIDDGHDFLLIFDAEEWDELTFDQKTALVDHELMHCYVTEEDEDGNVKFVLRGHDLEAFNDEVERHGSWKADIGSFLDAASHFNINEENNLKK